MLIDSFSGQYAFLSNFNGGQVEVFGCIFPTAEHAFQAAKSTRFEDLNKILAIKSASAAKRAARKFELRPDWEDIKVDVMRQVLAAKFFWPRGGANNSLAVKLVRTHPHHLVEGNDWGDKFWGCVRPPDVQNGPWVGANHLGILLMERRDQLIAQTQ
jgi:N-glycosidase YbiA